MHVLSYDFESAYHSTLNLNFDGFTRARVKKFHKWKIFAQNISNFDFWKFWRTRVKIINIWNFKKSIFFARGGFELQIFRYKRVYSRARVKNFFGDKFAKCACACKKFWFHAALHARWRHLNFGDISKNRTFENYSLAFGAREHARVKNFSKNKNLHIWIIFSINFSF